MHDHDEGIGRICRAIRREMRSKCIDPARIPELADKIADLASKFDDDEPEEVEEEELEDDDDVLNEDEDDEPDYR